jgi:hypothetical protein
MHKSQTHATDTALDPRSTPSPEVLPRYFFRRLRLQFSGRGELRLAVAVLEDAVHCLERHREAQDFEGRLILWEAEQWIRSEEEDALFSFNRICGLLGLNEKDLRNVLLCTPKAPATPRFPGLSLAVAPHSGGVDAPTP